MSRKWRTKVCRLRLFCIAAGLSNIALIAAAPGASAQISSFAPSNRIRATVSLRELQVPSEARKEFERGLRRLQKQDATGSMRYFHSALERFPQYYEAYYHQGIAELKLGKNEEALHSFQMAIDLSDGRYAQAQFGYALALGRQGNAEEAERIVRYGLETEPNVPDGHIVLGLVLLKLNRVDEAEKSARRGLLLDNPKSGKGYLVLADVDAARSDYDAQARDLESYLKLHPDDANAPLFKAARDAARRLAAKSAQKSREAGAISVASRTP